MRHQREEFSLKDAVDFLYKSELAEYICEARVVRGCCSIDCRAIRAGVNRAKIKFTAPQENPGFYGFVRDHIYTIIGLVEDNASGVRLASKSIQLTEDAHTKFLQGWEIAKQRFGNYLEQGGPVPEVTESADRLIYPR